MNPFNPTPLATSPLASSRVCQKYGVQLSLARYFSSNFWHIHSELQGIFSTYYLLQWSGEYFRHRLHEGTIERDGITYQAIYHNTDPREIKSAPVVFLSFRSLVEDYETMPTVLVALNPNGARN